ncbi:primosomal replication protein [Anabaena minutissima FACHB-250]|nr:primosomal replication protein [Anabaena minutissima FACHB-250]
MAECKDIDKALANLAKKIDAQNQCCNESKAEIKRLKDRIGALERANKNNNNGKQQQTKPQDLTPIYKRLNKLENYCESVESFIKGIEPLIKSLVGMFL